MPDLDNLDPGLGGDIGGAEQHHEIPQQDGGHDREGAMAKADLYKLASYSHKLFKQLDDNDQLEAWVQAKITKAADYIASVYHYMEYEMKFSEYGKSLDNSDVLSEGEKTEIRNRLMEAKMKIAELKKAQAEKLKEKTHVHEGLHSQGREMPCAECGGTGVVYAPISEKAKNKAQKYNTLMKASKAAHKRMDANHNGIPDDMEGEHEMEEDQSELTKVGSSYKTKRGGTVTKTSTGLRHEKGDYSDEPHVDAQKAPSKAGMTGAERRAQKAQDKEDSKGSKDWEKRFGKGSVTRHSVSDKSRDEKADSAFAKDDKMSEGKKKGDGNLANNAKPYDKVTRGDVIAGRLGKDEKGGKAVKEAAPSAGLSKAKKSATVKKAKAGGDIGKPGKNFDKLAKKAGGGEKGEKIAAAAMWKNIKETTAYVAEKKAAVKDLPGKQEKLDVNHNGRIEGDDLAKLRSGKKETVKESEDFGQFKANLSRLLG